MRKGLKKKSQQTARAAAASKAFSREGWGIGPGNRQLGLHWGGISRSEGKGGRGREAAEDIEGLLEKASKLDAKTVHTLVMAEEKEVSVVARGEKGVPKGDSRIR